MIWCDGLGIRLCLDSFTSERFVMELETRD